MACVTGTEGDLVMPGAGLVEVWGGLDNVNPTYG